jgi:hypothetical protein
MKRGRRNHEIYEARVQESHKRRKCKSRQSYECDRCLTCGRWILRSSSPS